MNANRDRAYDPYRGRYLTWDEAEVAASNPRIWTWIQWEPIAEEVAS